MSIKNYTSEVSVERSIQLIEHELVRAKATHIAKWYDSDGKVEGLMFQINLPATKAGAMPTPMSFKLPARWRKCFDILYAEVKKPLPTTKERVEQQAQRTAWKLLYDMVAVKVSMILIDQVEAVEEFLPYYYDQAKDRTLYESIRDSGFKQLTAGAKQ